MDKQTEIPPPARIPAVWNISGGAEIARLNADLTWTVNWPEVERLAADEPPLGDLQAALLVGQMRLLLAGRGRITEVSLEEADRIAEQAGAAWEASTLSTLAE